MTRRHYDQRTKLSAVLAADMVGLTAASEQTGIPKQTIDYWMDRPEFGPFRTKAREDLQDEIKLTAHLAWQRTAEALAANTMEPRDVLFAAEKATTLMLLVGGEATARTETKDLTVDLPDDIKRDLRDRFSDRLRATDEGVEAEGAQGAATPAG
jgi:hypothetical protein